MAEDLWVGACAQGKSIYAVSRAAPQMTLHQLKPWWRRRTVELRSTTPLYGASRLRCLDDRLVLLGKHFVANVDIEVPPQVEEVPFDPKDIAKNSDGVLVAVGNDGIWFRDAGVWHRSEGGDAQETVHFEAVTATPFGFVAVGNRIPPRETTVFRDLGARGRAAGWRL